MHGGEAYLCPTDHFAYRTAEKGFGKVTFMAVSLTTPENDIIPVATMAGPGMVSSRTSPHFPEGYRRGRSWRPWTEQP